MLENKINNKSGRKLRLEHFVPVYGFVKGLKEINYDLVIDTFPDRKGLILSVYNAAVFITPLIIYKYLK